MALFFDIGTDYTKFEKELLEKNRLLNERLEAQTLTNETLTKQLAIQGVGCSLPSKEAIAIEAERRHPYKKHLVDFNNGTHEGFIDGADFVLESIKNNK